MKKYLLIALVLFSCKRDVTTPPSPVTNDPEKVTIRLAMSGDYSLSDGNLRAIYDTTIYAVDIKTLAGTLYAQGLFNTPDSIKFDLLRDSSYQVKIAAIKRGSGPGLWWQLSSGYRQYAAPIQGQLRNRIAYTSLVQGFLDSLAPMKMFADTATSAFTNFPFAELDTYYGSSNYTARDPNNTTINILLRRLSFALQYNIHNLSSGYVLATYGGKMAPDTMRTNDTLPRKIYTADRFRTLESIEGAQLQVTLTWVKGDGSSQVLGTKPVRPKRNSATAITVYLDTPPGQVIPGFQLSDTTWLGTKDYYY